MLLALFIPHSILNKKDTDPLAEEEKNFLNAKTEAQDKAIQEVTTWLLEEVRKESESGRKNVPSMQSLLARLDTSLAAQDQTGDQYDIMGAKRQEISKLAKIYRYWELICQ